MLGNGKQFLPLIRQPPCKAYIDSIQCNNKLKLTLKTGNNIIHLSFTAFGHATLGSQFTRRYVKEGK